MHGGKLSHHKRAPLERLPCRGWTDGVARRQRHFFYTVDKSALVPFAGTSLSLTLRDIPATAADFHRLRTRLFDRLRYAGMSFCHWCVEFQKRGAPHLHMAIYFPDDLTISLRGSGDIATTKTSLAGFAVPEIWCDVASDYSPAINCQHAAKIYGIMGWLSYCDAHMCRSVKNYQRQLATLPDGWKNKTGRMWGYVGNFPTTPPTKHEGESVAEFNKLSRAVVRYRKAQARGRLLSAIQKHVGDDFPIDRVRRMPCIRILSRQVVRRHKNKLQREISRYITRNELPPDFLLDKLLSMRDRKRRGVQMRGIDLYLPLSAQKRLLTWAALP